MPIKNVDQLFCKCLFSYRTYPGPNNIASHLINNSYKKRLHFTQWRIDDQTRFLNFDWFRITSLKKAGIIVPCRYSENVVIQVFKVDLLYNAGVYHQRDKCLTEHIVDLSSNLWRYLI